MDKSPSFRTRARIINQLGEQLIKNESIALLELIKNSYDADASECNIIMKNPDSTDEGEIVIWDDGEGMDYDVLSKGWLEIGSSFKDDLRKNLLTKRTPKYGRLRLGEKGIGRLGVHRLGNEIEIITRRYESLEYILKIDWDDIEKTKYIEDFPVDIIERSPLEFTSGSGTKITIRRLKVPWTRKMTRESARSIVSLNSPFDSADSFRATFTVLNSDWLEGILTFEDIEKYKLFSFNVKIKGNQLYDFLYEFIPWDTMNKLSPRRITSEDKEIKELSRMVYKEKHAYKDVDISKFRIGEVQFKGVIFDRDTRTLDLGVQDRQGLKKYLDQNGGVRVFRDNMRIMDYGEPGNDWLNLGGRRINMPAKRISNNIILAAVYLNHSQSEDLQEKANREGFVENEAYHEFLKAIIFVLDRIESCRKTDKDLLRKQYGPQKVSEPIVTSISELKDVVSQNVKDELTKNEILHYLERIENEYELMTNSLIKSAGAGLNLITIIHQIEKIIKDIKVMLKKKVSFELLEERITTLSTLVEGYSILVKNSEKKNRNLKAIVEQTVFNMDFRLEAHEIKLDKAFLKRTESLDALCSESHVLNALMNLFDNSIWWLGYSKTKDPEIFLDISDALPGYVSIIVADNGPGFTKPTEEIIKPFVSDKPGGMGIGLNLTYQIMESLGGKLLFPEMEIFDIPAKYEKGAKIALAFKKGSY